MRTIGTMKRVDSNQPSIVKMLRQAGCSVQSLADVGDGCPDIVCGYHGKNYLFEIKDWKQPPSKRRLTPHEKQWHLTWRGQVHIAETFDEVMAVMQANGG